jgi:hypothetical protein
VAVNGSMKGWKTRIEYRRTYGGLMWLQDLTFA